MKDLYRRNHLNPLEDNVVKINNCKSDMPEDSEAAYSILLNEERKRQYDQAYKALSSVANLRKRYDLSTKNDWHRSYADFLVEQSPKPKANKSDHGNKPSETREQPTNKKSQSSMMYMLVGLAAVVSIVAMFSGPNDEQKSLQLEKELEKNIWKYTLENVALYEQPDLNSDVVGEIKQFEDTRVFINKGSRQWDYLHYGYLEGYVQKDLLVEGNGEAAFVQHCKNLPSSRPANGSPLIYSTTGPHTLIVINPPGHDAIIKLRDMQQREIIAYYVHGRQTLTLSDIPNGDFVFSYAIGKNYSPSCGRFLEEMRAWKDINVVTFKMEKRGAIEHSSSKSFSLKDQFSVNTAIDNKFF